MSTIKLQEQLQHASPKAPQTDGDDPTIRAAAVSPENAEVALRRIDVLWKVIGRFDLYITSVNAKAAMVATFNTFVITAIVLKWEEILAQFGPYVATTRIAGSLLAVAAIASVVSLWFTFRALGPFLDSHKAPGRYHSSLFFGHVAEHASGDDYRACFTDVSADSLVVDLCNQAHALARGARDKFRDMRLALQFIAFAQLPAMGALILVKLVLLLFVQ